MSRSSPARALAGRALSVALRLPRQPCPFCGCEPHVTFAELNEAGEAIAVGESAMRAALNGFRTEARVVCVSRYCVAPCVEVTVRRAKPAAAVRKALERWNKRAPLPEDERWKQAGIEARKRMPGGGGRSRVR